MALLLGGGVVLRLMRLGNLPGVNGDEAWMGAQAMRLLAGEEVAWWTPTGNPLNPFSFVPLLLTHLIFPPSIAHLRWVAAASGLVLLPVNFVLCRLVYGPKTAAVTTVALAVLPVTIAYSRFAWDASQSVLFTLPVLYLPLAAWRLPDRQWRFLAIAAIALVACVVVHPTNVFAAPLLVVPGILLAVAALRERFSVVSAGLKTVACLLAAITIAGVAIAGIPWWRPAVRRLVSPEQFIEFARLFVELFSGVTIYRFVSATMLDAQHVELMIVQTVSILAIVAIGWGLYRKLGAGGDQLDRVLVAGFLITVAGFYLVAGPTALRPHYERYAQCLMAGGVLIVARGLEWFLSDPRFRRSATVSLLSLAGLSLAGFVGLYWLPLAEGRTKTHPTFRTGTIDPKQAALELALDELGPGPATIGAGSWWAYWPLEYLAARDSRITVVTDGGFGRGIDQQPDCWIELDDTPSYERRARDPTMRKVSILNPAGRPLVSLFFSANSHRASGFSFDPDELDEK